MPASVELLSILRSNASLRELFGDVLGSAPRLGAGDRVAPACSRRRDRSRAGEGFRRQPGRRPDAQARRGLCRPGAQLRGYAEPRARFRRRGNVPHRPQSPVGPARSRPRRPRLQRARARPGRTAADARVRRACRRIRESARRPRRDPCPRQARLARDDCGLGPRPDCHLRFPLERRGVERIKAARRCALLFAPGSTAARGADRADQGRPPLRGRHAAQALRPPGAARHAILGLHALPARRSGDLGAYGADARARRSRAIRASRPMSPRRCAAHSSASATRRRSRARCGRCAR